MTSRRAIILGGIGSIVPFSVLGKNKKSNSLTSVAKMQVSNIVEGTPRSEYLPLPTPLSKFGEPNPERLMLPLKNSTEDIPTLFRSARDFFSNGFHGSIYEEKKRMLERKYPGFEMIPYIIAPAHMIEEKKETSHTELIFLARRRNPKPTGSADWLLEWVGPIEGSFSIDIMGVAPKAKTREEAIQAKTLGAGTNFRILEGGEGEFSQGAQGREYMVLATRYPQYGQKEAIIQTPFSEGLASKEVMARGREYFEGLQGDVTRLLVEASWSELLKDIEWYKVIQGLILTENMNPAPAGLTETEEIVHYEREVRKVYALLGANGKDAFRRSSSMGAKGIVQFTEGAWEGRGLEWDRKNNKGKRTGIRHTFPLPGFRENPDFSTVIADHVLSILAACAHITSQYQEYNNSAFAPIFQAYSHPVKHVLLSAGYNSNNTERVKDLSRAHQNGQGGISGILERFYRTLSNSGADETRGYMRKFLFALKSLGYSIPETSFFRIHGYNPRE